VFSAGDQIITEGNTGTEFYIIAEGKVTVHKEGIQVRRMHAGSYFGEQALLYDCQRTATIRAATPVTCYCIGKEKLEKVLGNRLINTIYRGSCMIAIENDAQLKELSIRQMNIILEEIKVV
jgi:CRP-like cAMP-binding protein